MGATGGEIIPDGDRDNSRRGYWRWRDHSRRATGGADKEEEEYGQELPTCWTCKDHTELRLQAQEVRRLPLQSTAGKNARGGLVPTTRTGAGGGERRAARKKARRPGEESKEARDQENAKK